MLWRAPDCRWGWQQRRPSRLRMEQEPLMGSDQERSWTDGWPWQWNGETGNGLQAEGDTVLQPSGSQKSMIPPIVRSV